MNRELPTQPLASCITPTANRRRFLPQAIQCFLQQDYPKKELIIIDDGEDPVGDLVPQDERIRYIRLPCKTVLGQKRNRAAAEAKGEIIVHWDDDDWSAPWRLHYQVEELMTAGADICGLDRVFFYAPSQQRAWEYVYPGGQRPWVYGASLAYRKTFWTGRPFANIGVGEDTKFVWADANTKIQVLKDPHCLVALIHSGNCSPKRTSDARYQPRPVKEIERLLGAGFRFYTDPQCCTGPSNRALTEAKPKPRALVSAALGVGDILRITPLIRVVHRLGYEVDVLLATDYADAVSLLEDAPEIRTVFHLPSPRRGKTSNQDPRLTPQVQPDGLSDQTYDIATFTTWSAALRDRVKTRNVHLFEQARWLAEGDNKCVERIARALGWQGELPPPFAMPSSRKFDLPPGTIAIHPGCKEEWPWKKWHGFDELARLFGKVVIVGAEEDLRTDNTYFGRAFCWPANAQNFVGKLSLSDTAALLRECAALVSNDSGLMHLGAALGIPTFGIFGITSPHREMICTPNMFPITKELPCEPACRQGPWGRRDCEYHLRCLQTLTPEEVYMKVTATLPELKNGSDAPEAGSVAPAPADHQHRQSRGREVQFGVATNLNSNTPTLHYSNTPISHVPALDHEAPNMGSNETIAIAYYGYVFDASGYGQAARAYLHALHQAGIQLTVIDLAGNRPRQVEDHLVASLVAQPSDVDFHLFHGTPPLWARMAFPLRNVIAMTVWETDTMPTQWRPILTHAVDVWLPCEFNADVFSAALGRPVFKLPHPVFLAETNGDAATGANEWGIQPDDFVFYAIFEWQDRKSPERTMEAYFRAFREEDHIILVLKTNPGAAAVAARALEEVRKRTGSQARATVRAEAWSEAQIAALHARGDCYVSLHRGEGWCYPLFEAAARGNPVIATGYSGPLDFLAADAHYLVRHTLTAVRQPYAYYRPSMKWAEPDTAHATELMNEVRTKGDEARKRAADAAQRLVHDFSLEAVGHHAKRRLLKLLQRTDNAKWERLEHAQQTVHLRPPLPIPGEWFDADYFDRGVKSNWKNGYHWRDFAGLFRDTARFLVTMFPEAGSFLDVGCAKGFLVRALRELGKDAWGFDHSVWALERAEEAARPFLQHTSAENAEFTRSFDILLAFFLLESLTEDQAQKFLERFRVHTEHALLAAILTCEDKRDRERLAGEDCDLSHITLRSRAWWHELLLRCGWRQDSLHRVAEQACQRHELPTRMCWRMFVYSPS